MAIVSPFTGQTLTIKTSPYTVAVDGTDHIKYSQTLSDAVDLLISLNESIPNASSYTITNGTKTVTFMNIAAMSSDQLMAFYNNN